MAEGRKTALNEEEQKRESGLPGGGKGRRDVIEPTGVYPLSHSEGAGPGATVHPEGSFGQGDRGAEGYADSGGSEIYHYPGELEGDGGAAKDTGKAKTEKG